jgi:hypothetical protein
MRVLTSALGAFETGGNEHVELILENGGARNSHVDT